MNRFYKSFRFLLIKRVLIYKKNKESKFCEKWKLFTENTCIQCQFSIKLCVFLSTGQLKSLSKTQRKTNTDIKQNSYCEESDDLSLLSTGREAVGKRDWWNSWMKWQSHIKWRSGWSAYTWAPQTFSCRSQRRIIIAVFIVFWVYNEDGWRFQMIQAYTLVNVRS